MLFGDAKESVENNTLCFAPALIATKDDIDQIVDAVDGALGTVFG